MLSTMRSKNERFAGDERLPRPERSFFERSNFERFQYIEIIFLAAEKSFGS